VTTTSATETRLAHFPVTLFSSVMGLGGVSLAWRRAAMVWALPEWPYLVFLLLAVLAFLVVGCLYAVKWLRHPLAARAELRHPVRMAFAPTLTIAILVLATALSDLAPGAASALWWVGALGHLTATVAVLTAWFARSDILAGHVTPAWFIPVVGNLITPLAAASIGSVELGWFAFGVGLVFWLGLLPLMLQRLLTHHEPLPAKLLPTIAIFSAPPAVAMLSWQSLTEASADPVSRILYAATVMFVLLLLAQVGHLRALPFALPFWAYTFPLAASAVAAIAMAGQASGIGYDLVAGVLLALATVTALVVTAMTLRAASRGQICVPEQ
jgi:tellurite resistance protein